MEVRWLETFAAAARAGSMSAAANKLGYARSTVTHHVQSLERSLGTKLFDRGEPGRPLTKTGEVLLGHAEVVLEQLTMARVQIARLESIEPRGLPRGSSVNCAVAPVVVAHPARRPLAHAG